MEKLNAIEKPWNTETGSYSAEPSKWCSWLTKSNIEDIHFPDFKRALTYSNARSGDEISAYLNNESIVTWTLGSDLDGVSLREWFNNQFPEWHKRNKISPLQKQYNSIKAKYPNALLLFRVNDYYECFNKDAVVISQILDIPLTETKDSKKLAGFTYELIDLFLPKLVKAGHRVAICDQLANPKSYRKEEVKRKIPIEGSLF